MLTRLAQKGCGHCWSKHNNNSIFPEITSVALDSRKVTEHILASVNLQRNLVGKTLQVTVLAQLRDHNRFYKCLAI